MPNQEKDHVFLGTPLGATGTLSGGTHWAILNATRSKRQVFPQHNAMSLLPFAFNDLWCKALNARAEHGINRFVMIHSDIQPLSASWLDELLDELDRSEADVLSVVVAIKDPNGLSSTAVDTHPFRPKRLTFHEIARLPTTFDWIDTEILYDTKKNGRCGLLINTGLMAVRFDRPWVESVCFDFTNKIEKRREGYIPEVEPEDWKFSRWCATRGLLVKATTKIVVVHLGSIPFRNDRVWGKMKVDEINAEHY